MSTVCSNLHTALVARQIDPNGSSFKTTWPVARAILREAHEAANEQGVELLVLVLPTKQRVFYDLMVERGYELAEPYHELKRNEDGPT